MTILYLLKKLKYFKVFAFLNIIFQKELLMRKLLFSLLLLSHLTANGLINSQTMLNIYRQHFNGIEGWFYSPFIDVLIKLDELQNKKQINGNLAEIGVFHGKSFILLYLLSNPNERVLAVDCFDLQQFNYDNSGPGCKFDSFIRNVKTFCDPEITKLEVFTSRCFGNDCTKLLTSL